MLKDSLGFWSDSQWFWSRWGDDSRAEMVRLSLRGAAQEGIKVRIRYPGQSKRPAAGWSTF